MPIVARIALTFLIVAAGAALAVLFWRVPPGWFTTLGFGRFRGESFSPTLRQMGDELDTHPEFRKVLAAFPLAALLMLLLGALAVIWLH
jgi:hypothetical protein